MDAFRAPRIVPLFFTTVLSSELRKLRFHWRSEPQKLLGRGRTAVVEACFFFGVKTTKTKPIETTRVIGAFTASFFLNWFRVREEILPGVAKVSTTASD